jgi:hypothetical protein
MKISRVCVTGPGRLSGSGCKQTTYGKVQVSLDQVAGKNENGPPCSAVEEEPLCCNALKKMEHVNVVVALATTSFPFAGIWPSCYEHMFLCTQQVKAEQRRCRGRRYKGNYVFSRSSH